MSVVEPVNLFDFESIAQEKMGKGHYDFVAGGAMDEITLRRTRAAYDAIALRPRVLAGVSEPDLSTTVLGEPLALPVMLAPTGGLTRSHPEGELEAARAAAQAGTLMCVSANSSFTLEEISEAAAGPKWFQSYLFQDRGVTTAFADRADAAGYRALVLTLDAHWAPKRERDIRNDYRRTPGANYAGMGLKQEMGRGESPRPLVDPLATWKDLEWLRSRTGLPVVLKGILTAEDAALAAQHGADALIVSNHGGRNLDATLTTIEALPEVVKAVDGRIPVLMDGGVRRGADVVKALALGAAAVLVGRPVFWSLAYGGKEGVCLMLRILRDEMELTLRAVGRASLSEIDPTLVARVMPSGISPNHL